MTTALSVYSNRFAASGVLSTANLLVTAGGGSSTATKTVLVGAATGWGEFWSQGKSTAWAAAGSMGAPSGHGWFLDGTTLDGQAILAGAWTPTWGWVASALGITADIWVNAYVYQSGSYTLIGSMSVTGFAIPTAIASPSWAGASLGLTPFATGARLYLDTWVHITANSAGAGTTIAASQCVGSGVGSSLGVVVTPGYVPAAVLAATLSGAGTLSAGAWSLSTAFFAILGGAGALSGSLGVPVALAVTLAGAGSLFPSLAAESAVTTVTVGANPYAEIMSQGSAGTTGAAALPTVPSGHGWVYRPGAGSFAAGDWQATITLSAAGWGGSAATTQVFLRAYLYSGGFFSPIGAWAGVGITSLAKTAYLFPATSMDPVVTGPQDLVYFDLWWMDTAGIAGDNPTVYVSASATTEIANDLAIGLPVFTPAGGGPGGGPGPLPVASTTYIDGVAYETEAGTLLIDAAVGRRSTASFQTRTAGSVHFEQYQQVAIYDQNTQLAFSGYLTSPQEAYPGAPDVLIHTVTCCDQHYLADKRVVAAVYQGQTPGSMAKDLWMRYLAPEGVTIGQIIDTGIAVPETVFAFCTAAEALDALAQAASSAGVPYFWQIDFQQALWFVPYTALVNVNRIDGTQIDLGGASGVVPTLTRANPLYRNTQYIAGAVAQTGIQSETRHGDGTSRTFSMGYALGNAAPTITKNGTAQTVGLKGTSGSQWYWAQGDDVVTQDSGETLLVATDTLVVVYTGQYPTVVLDKNSGQIAYQGALDGSTGIVETVEQDNTITSVASGMQRAGQLLTRYATQGSALVVATLVSGYAPGQLVTVDLPMFGLAGAQMLLESVSASDQQDSYNLWYTLTLILGPYDTSWTTFFSTLLASVQPPNSLNVGLSTAVGLVEEFLASLGLSGTGTGTLSATPLPSPLLYPSAVLYPG